MRAIEYCLQVNRAGVVCCLGNVSNRGESNGMDSSSSIGIYVPDWLTGTSRGLTGGAHYED